jgi:hypothetical protein
MSTLIFDLHTLDIGLRIWASSLYAASTPCIEYLVQNQGLPELFARCNGKHTRPGSPFALG